MFWHQRKLMVLSLLGFALVIAGASAGSCRGLGKLSDATDPAVESAATTSVACASFAIFKSRVDPVLQSRCASCHLAGGAGGGVYSFVPNTDDIAIGSNFASTITKISSDNLGAPDSNDLLLTKLNGTLSHSITLDLASDEYAALREWIVEESLTPCEAMASKKLPAAR